MILIQLMIQILTKAGHEYERLFRHESISSFCCLPIKTLHVNTCVRRIMLNEYLNLAGYLHSNFRLYWYQIRKSILF